MPKQTHITPTEGDDGQEFSRAFEIWIPLDRRMQSPAEIAGAMERLARQLREDATNSPEESYEVLGAVYPSGYLTDVNDRTAGTWQVVEA